MTKPIPTTLALALTLALTSLNACSGQTGLDLKDIPDLTCEAVLLPPGVCVQISPGDPPVFRPCDLVDYVKGVCTYRVLDTVQVQPLEIAMPESDCYALKAD